MHGTTETLDFHDWDVLWSLKPVFSKGFREVMEHDCCIHYDDSSEFKGRLTGWQRMYQEAGTFEPHQTKNHCMIPGLIAGNKVMAAMTFNRARRHWGADFDFWYGSEHIMVLPRDRDTLLGIMARIERNHPGARAPWALKQSLGNRGEGVRVVYNRTEIPRNDRPYIVQPYMVDPLLIEGHKFHIRAYLAMSSLEPLQIWMHQARHDFAEHFHTH